MALTSDDLQTLIDVLPDALSVSDLVGVLSDIVCEYTDDANYILFVMQKTVELALADHKELKYDA